MTTDKCDEIIPTTILKTIFTSLHTTISTSIIFTNIPETIHESIPGDIILLFLRVHQLQFSLIFLVLFQLILLYQQQ